MNWKQWSDLRDKAAADILAAADMRVTTLHDVQTQRLMIENASRLHEVAVRQLACIPCDDEPGVHISKVREALAELSQEIKEWPDYRVHVSRAYHLLRDAIIEEGKA